MEENDSSSNLDIASDGDDSVEEVKSDGLPVLSFSSLKGSEYLSTQLITSGIQHSTDVYLELMTMEEINALMTQQFEECKYIDQAPIYVDPRGKLKEEKKSGQVQTLVDYDDIANLAQIASGMYLEYL